MTDNEKTSTLRGIGRYSYRMGGMVHHACQSAADTLGRPLSADERAHVMAGWSAERQDMAESAEFGDSGTFYGSEW